MQKQWLKGSPESPEIIRPPDKMELKVISPINWMIMPETVIVSTARMRGFSFLSLYITATDKKFCSEL